MEPRGSGSYILERDTMILKWEFAVDLLERGLVVLLMIFSMEEANEKSNH